MSMYTHDYIISAVFHLGPPRQLRTGRVGGLDETDGFVKHAAPLCADCPNENNGFVELGAPVRRSPTAVSKSNAQIAPMKPMVV